MNKNFWYWIIGIAILLVIGYVVYASMFLGKITPTGSTINEEDNSQKTATIKIVDDSETSDYVEVTVDTKTGEVVGD